MLKAVKLAEILKRKVPGLHQLNQVTRFKDEKVYVPLEEGLDDVRIYKDITMFKIRLSKTITEDLKSHYGYQAPLSDISDGFDDQYL